MKKTLSTIALALCLPAFAACSSDSDALTGSAVNIYDLQYDEIRIERQVKQDVLQAIKISYIKDPSGPNEQFPVIVIVNAPVTTGEQIDFAPPGGSMTRVMADASTFPEIVSATIRFDSLGEVGARASGKFNVTFKDEGDGERTLNGEFGGTVKLLSAN